MTPAPLVLTLIAAMDARHLLADSGSIPWSLPADTIHFRAYTRGKWLLIGRRTFGEMRGWFEAGHAPLVLSSSRDWEPAVGRVVSSVPRAIALAAAAGQAELVCCGGGSTYAAALPHARRMVLTLLDREFPAGAGPVHFPPWNPADWRAVSEMVLDRRHRDEPTARVLTLERLT